MSIPCWRRPGPGLSARRPGHGQWLLLFVRRTSPPDGRHRFNVWWDRLTPSRQGCSRVNHCKYRMCVCAYMCTRPRPLGITYCRRQVLEAGGAEAPPRNLRSWYVCCCFIVRVPRQRREGQRFYRKGSSLSGPPVSKLRLGGDYCPR